MSAQRKSITERIYKNIIAGDSVKRQALITGEFNFLASLVIFFTDFPFPKLMGIIALISSISYFIFYLTYHKIPEKRFTKVTGLLSAFAFIVLAAVIHLSGGITSPFIFLYFCVYIFENIGGIANRYSPYFGILSYTLVICLEFFGTLPVYSSGARAIYDSPLTTFIVSFSTVSFMATVAYSANLIYENVKNKLSSEAREREMLIAKYAQLEKQGNLGLIAHRVVHDMRTPLTLIKNYIKMSRKNEEIRNDERRFGAIQDSIDKLSQSMEAIVAYARKGQDYQSRQANICEIVENTITVMKFYSADIGYEFSVSKVENEKAYFNPSEFYTVIFNLLKNAVEAFEGEKNEKKLIKVNCREDEDFLFVEIFDNGPAFPENMLGAAFKDSFTTKKDGSGLGLMIVKDLCDQNDAQIKLENKGDKYGVLITLKLKKIAG